MSFGPLNIKTLLILCKLLNYYEKKDPVKNPTNFCAGPGLRSDGRWTTNGANFVSNDYLH